MSRDDSATGHARTSISAVGWGLLGVVCFSFTVPLTKVATRGFDPLVVGAGRALVGALLAAIALAATRQAWPTRAQWRRIAVVGGGIVAGFPLLTSFALTSAPASHGAVVIALLPAATAVAAVLRGREWTSGAFWAMVAAGAVAAVGFAVVQGGGIAHLHGADALLFAAVIAGAIGYAEGGLLARQLGAWQTVSWALVLYAPVMAVLAAVGAWREPVTGDPVQWLAFAYLGIVSAFLGFFAWYRGLALGPIARISQVQLIQPVLSIAWAALLLGEVLSPGVVVGALAVVCCAAGAVRVRTASPPALTPGAGSPPAGSAVPAPASPAPTAP